MSNRLTSLAEAVGVMRRRPSPVMHICSHCGEPANRAIVWFSGKPGYLCNACLGKRSDRLNQREMSAEIALSDLEDLYALALRLTHGFGSLRESAKEVRNSIPAIDVTGPIDAATLLAVVNGVLDLCNRFHDVEQRILKDEDRIIASLNRIKTSVEVGAKVIGNSSHEGHGSPVDASGRESLRD